MQVERYIKKLPRLDKDQLINEPQLLDECSSERKIVSSLNADL